MKTAGPVILIGFKGAGKSLIGRALAKKLNMEYSDTDAIIEGLHDIFEGQKLTCREIHKKHGAEYFRKLEAEAIKEALNSTYSVVSFGGGALATMQTAGIDPRGALFVYLSAEKEELYRRIMQDGVPAIFDTDNPRDSFDRLYAERTPGYERYATIRVDNTNRKSEDVVDSIIALMDKIPSAPRQPITALETGA
jgi:shikimate kinase